jgi:hypothetical protein
LAVNPPRRVAQHSPVQISPFPEVRVTRERHWPYAIALCLLLAGAIPELAWTADGGFAADFAKPTPSAAAFGPELSRAVVFYPAVAGLLALFLAWSMPRWVRALGFVGLGASLLAFGVDRGGVAAAANGQFDAVAPLDALLLVGIALAFVATRAQSEVWARRPLSLLGAVGGLAVLVWLLVPGVPSSIGTWFGMVSQNHPDTITIVRGLLRNGEFPAGTHPVWYVWWNLYLAALIAFPLLCLRVPARPWELREGAADVAYGALVLALLNLALTPVITAAIDYQLKFRSPDGATGSWQSALVCAANAARLVFPPLLLAGLALAGISDLLKEVSELKLPRLRLPRLWVRKPPPPPLRRVARPEVGRITLRSERYASVEAPKGR